MADQQSRIEQFRKLTQSNPADPVPFVSLGRAYLDEQAYDDAVLALQRALALDGRLSKAYELLARAQLGLERRAEAARTLDDGIRVAHQRGDQMVKNEMIAMLTGLGGAIPTFEPAAPQIAGEGQVVDRRTGRVGTRLGKPPVKGKLGQVIFEHVSAESWREWIGQGTKVINELRLPLTDPSAQKVYEQHMIEYLNLRELL